MKTETKPKCEVLIAKEWHRCKRAVKQPSGWLHYELADGTNGLAQPKNWRVAKAESR